MSRDPTDEALALAAGRGDDGAFTALMERHERAVLDFIYRMTGDPVEAQDVAQTVFVRAYQALAAGKYHPARAAFSTWLFRIARYAAIDALRRQRRRPVIRLPDLPDRGETLAATGASAPDAVAAGELGAAIAAAVARLPDDQRTAFALSEYQGLSQAAVAAVMKSSVKSVEARLYRARNALRTRLAAFLE